ncbi:MAG: sensor histidine kinase [Burkholderiales bacterium]
MSDTEVAGDPKEWQDEVRLLRAANRELTMSALESQHKESTATAAYRQQAAFLATVAHELRNPLLPLRLATQMLAKARTDEAAFTALQSTISGQVADMARLINDLVDGARVSTGKFRLERTVVDICSLIHLAVRTCTPAIEARRHQLSVSLPQAPIKVLGDRLRLVQVFDNLIGNAAKYTLPGGEISVGVSIEGAEVAVSIKDNGTGISREALPHIFELYVQDKHVEGVEPGGLGIGLSVVRELVTAHEGSVLAFSDRERGGSEFVVRLPLASVGLA